MVGQKPLLVGVVDVRLEALGHRKERRSSRTTRQWHRRTDEYLAFDRFVRAIRVDAVLSGDRPCLPGFSPSDSSVVVPVGPPVSSVAAVVSALPSVATVVTDASVPAASVSAGASLPLGVVVVTARRENHGCCRENGDDN